MKRALKALRPQPQQPQGNSDVVRAATNDRLFTEREAAEHCRYFDRGCADPVRAFQKFARRAGIPFKSVGRTRLYDRRVLDAFLDRQSWTRRHREPRAMKLVARG